MFTAASSQSVSFNQLHEKCGGRIKQQIMCPTCNEVLDRTQIVKGYEFAKEQYVRFTDQELKQLDGEMNQLIEIAEFVPLADVDPIYFEKTYYLGPDKGGSKAYRLLTDSMMKAGKVALAKFTMRGKENLVLIRASQDGLMLHAMYFADEIRDFSEIDKGKDATVKPAELDLAMRLIDDLTNPKFEPGKYHDEYRNRVLAVVEQKVEGKEIVAAGPAVQRTQVIDIMDALKQSLETRSSSKNDKAEKPEKKPAAKAKRAAAAPKERKVAGK
jgi:DNA end-binding protein Ku